MLAATLTVSELSRTGGGDGRVAVEVVRHASTLETNGAGTPTMRGGSGLLGRWAHAASARSITGSPRASTQRMPA
jgi:hypothetical protein